MRICTYNYSLVWVLCFTPSTNARRWNRNSREHNVSICDWHLWKPDKWNWNGIYFHYWSDYRQSIITHCQLSKCAFGLSCCRVVTAAAAAIDLGVHLIIRPVHSFAFLKAEHSFSSQLIYAPPTTGRCRRVFRLCLLPPLDTRTLPCKTIQLTVFSRWG